MRKHASTAQIAHDAQFDQVVYFRQLNGLVINLKNSAATDRSADIDAMFDLVATGKLAAETMSDAERKAFLTKIQQVSGVSSASLGLDGPTATTSIKDLDIKAPGVTTHISGEINPLAQQGYFDGTVRKKEAPKSGIVDRRELEFNSAAILNVIISSAGENARRPTNVEFLEDGIRIFRGSGHTMSLTSEQIGGLLIQYCIKMKIPIPRESAKSVRVTSKSVVLLFLKELPEISTQGVAWQQAERLK